MTDALEQARQRLRAVGRYALATPNGRLTVGVDGGQRVVHVDPEQLLACWHDNDDIDSLLEQCGTAPPAAVPATLAGEYADQQFTWKD